MKKRDLLFLIILLLPLGSWRPVTGVQYLTYDIFVSDSKIGEVQAEKSTKGNITTYSIQTNLSFRLFEKYNVNYQLSSSYKNELLIESALKNVVNGELEDHVYLKWNGTHYVGTANQKKILLAEKISYSIAKLYFHEPSGVQRIFSEKYVEFEKLKPEEGHQYLLHLGDGNKTRYTYQNGICTEVSSSKSFFKILFKLRN